MVSVGLENLVIDQQAVAFGSFSYPILAEFAKTNGYMVRANPP